MSVLDKYETADRAFRSGAVLSQDNETLLAHLHGLSNQNNTNSGTQHRDTIRGITINSILLQRHINSLQSHITNLDAKNAKLQWWVLLLAIAALVSTVVQTATALLPYVGVIPPEQPRLQSSQAITSNPTLQPKIQPAAETSKTLSTVGKKP